MKRSKGRFLTRAYGIVAKLWRRGEPRSSRIEPDTPWPRSSVQFPLDTGPVPLPPIHPPRPSE